LAIYFPLFFYCSKALGKQALLKQFFIRSLIPSYIPSVAIILRALRQPPAVGGNIATEFPASS